MVAHIIEVFMDDFSMVCDSFDDCLKQLHEELKQCEDSHLMLN